MKLRVFYIVLIASSCKNNLPIEFKITNPETKNINLWAKHKNIPKFNPESHSDGCSGGMSAFYKNLTFLHKKHGKTLQWRNCCVEHDKFYYYGGSKHEKKLADKSLNKCVTNIIGNRFLGDAMQIAVELGGGPYLPTNYRWGYGLDFIDPSYSD